MDQIRGAAGRVAGGVEDLDVYAGEKEVFSVLGRDIDRHGCDPLGMFVPDPAAAGAKLRGGGGSGEEFCSEPAEGAGSQGVVDVAVGEQEVGDVGGLESEVFEAGE